VSLPDELYAHAAGIDGSLVCELGHMSHGREGVEAGKEGEGRP
jgi:hypothetical protein